MKSVILCETDGSGDSLTVVDRSSASGSLPQFLLYSHSTTIEKRQIAYAQR